MIQDTVRTIRTGKNSAVTGTASLLVAAAGALGGYGVILKAPIANTQDVFIGISAAVTAGTADATDGFLLEPGERIQIDIDDPGRLYVISASGTQTLYWMQI